MITKLEALKTRLLKRADSRKAYSSVSREHWHSVDRKPALWGGKRHRWCDKPDIYFRQTQQEDTGWYADTYNDHTSHGVALYIGRGQWCGGCTDPWNDGPVMIECRSNGQPCLYDSKADALSCADDLARQHAEECREDDIKQTAEMRIEDAQTEIAETREKFHELADELRTGVSLPPAICDTIRGKLRSLRLEVRRSVARIAELRSNPHSILS